MKGFSFLKKIVYSPFFFASIPTIVTVMLLPSPGTKYKLQVDKVSIGYSGNFYADLNSDSISELLQTGKGVPYYYILVSDNDYHIYDQWNLKDIVDKDLSDFFIGNYDNDHSKEIYVFTHRDDSLFLNINEFFEPGGTKIERKFITRISVISGEVTSVCYPAGFYDENNDGCKELYFTITTGFGLEPRRAYYYDIKNDKLKSSQFTGMMCLRPKFFDSDGDTKPELFGFMSASGNYKTKSPFTDQSTWLMVFNEKLEFEFPPIEIPGFTNTLDINHFSIGKVSGYILSHSTGSTDTSVLKPGIMMFSKAGTLIRYHPYSYYNFTANPSLVIIGNHQSDRICLFGKELLELNDQLEIIKKAKSPLYSHYKCFYEDIDNDRHNDLLLYSENEEKLVLCNDDLKVIAVAKVRAVPDKMKFSHYVNKNKEYKLFLSLQDTGYFIGLVRNRYYYVGYLEYPVIFGLFLIFIFLIRRINTYQVVEKESLNRRLITLQLQGIKSQLDPHFTFNTLNSVASLIYLDDRKAAYDYMNKFTQLLRGMLNDAERIYRSLAEEIEFVTTYLDLEKLRFGNRINYRIEVGEGVSQQIQVPKMVLHTFAENAVKHGLMPLSEGGFLKINIDREDDQLKLTIEDNGIGRKMSEGKSTSTGRGLKLTGEFYEILNKMNKKQILHTITDLYDGSGNPVGTRVEVWIPENIE